MEHIVFLYVAIGIAASVVIIGGAAVWYVLREKRKAERWAQEQRGANHNQ